MRVLSYPTDRILVREDIRSKSMTSNSVPKNAMLRQHNKSPELLSLSVWLLQTTQEGLQFMQRLPLVGNPMASEAIHRLDISRLSVFRSGTRRVPSVVSSRGWEALFIAGSNSIPGEKVTVGILL